MAKADKTKLPKELGGFKLAKAIRKAQPIEELMSTPEGRAILSETVLAGLGAAIAVLRRPELAAETTEGDPEPRESRIAATRALAEGLNGVVESWTEQFGPAPAEANPPRKVARRRPAASPPQATGEATPAPSRRKPRAAAAKPAADDATLI